MKYARVCDTPHHTIAQSWNCTKAYYSTQMEQQISICSIVLEHTVYVLKWEVFLKIRSNRERKKSKPASLTCVTVHFLLYFFSPLLWLQALTMWKKKLPGFFPEKNSSQQSASEEDFKQHWEDWLCFRPNSLVPIGFFESPNSITEVSSTFSAHSFHACIHTPYWKKKLLPRLPVFSRTCSPPPRNLSKSNIDVVSLEPSPFGQVSLAAVNPRQLIFHCCFP